MIRVLIYFSGEIMTKPTCEDSPAFLGGPLMWCDISLATSQSTRCCISTQSRARCTGRHLPPQKGIRNARTCVSAGIPHYGMHACHFRVFLAYRCGVPCQER